MANSIKQYGNGYLKNHCIIKPYDFIKIHFEANNKKNNQSIKGLLLNV
jgi:hypothetical protein